MCPQPRVSKSVLNRKLTSNVCSDSSSWFSLWPDRSWWGFKSGPIGSIGPDLNPHLSLSDWIGWVVVKLLLFKQHLTCDVLFSERKALIEQHIFVSSGTSIMWCQSWTSGVAVPPGWCWLLWDASGPQQYSEIRQFLILSCVRITWDCLLTGC